VNRSGPGETGCAAEAAWTVASGPTATARDAGMTALDSAGVDSPAGVRSYDKLAAATLVWPSHRGDWVGCGGSPYRGPADWSLGAADGVANGSNLGASPAGPPRVVFHATDSPISSPPSAPNSLTNSGKDDPKIAASGTATKPASMVKARRPRITEDCRWGCESILDLPKTSKLTAAHHPSAGEARIIMVGKAKRQWQMRRKGARGQARN